MLENNADLVGRFFVGSGPDDEYLEGWVKRDLGSGFFLVEIDTYMGDDYSTVGRIMHFVEMRGWEFYKDPAIAQRHYDMLQMQGLEEIDHGSIIRSAKEELTDLTLEMLARSQAKKNSAEVERLTALLQSIANSTS